MRLDDEFMQRITQDAIDEVDRCCGVKIREKPLNDSFLSTQVSLVLAQAMAFSTLIEYHYRLRKELKKHNIDIGRLNFPDDPPETEFAD